MVESPVTLRGFQRGPPESKGQIRTDSGNIIYPVQERKVQEPSLFGEFPSGIHHSSLAFKTTFFKTFRTRKNIVGENLSSDKFK